jgi:hypothetical protein
MMKPFTTREVDDKGDDFESRYRHKDGSFCEAEISHGICPECMKKRFPDLEGG